MSDFFEEEVKRINADYSILQEFNSIPFKGYKINIIANIDSSKHGPRIKVMKNNASVMELPLSKTNDDLHNNKVLAGSNVLKTRAELRNSEDKEAYDIAKVVALQFSDRIIDFESGKLTAAEGKQLNNDINKLINKALKGKIK